MPLTSLCAGQQVTLLRVMLSAQNSGLVSVGSFLRSSAFLHMPVGLLKVSHLGSHLGLMLGTEPKTALATSFGPVTLWSLGRVSQANVLLGVSLTTYPLRGQWRNLINC